MNDIKVFSFYRNYYEIIKYLPDKERLILYEAIINYMFEDKEPVLEGLTQGIWINIKIVLDSTKKNINNGKKGGAPKGNQNAKKTTKKQPKNNQKTTQPTTQKQPNNIYYLFFIISSNKNIYKYIKINNKIYNKLSEWLEYKEQRKEKYTEIGLKKLLTQVDKKIDEFGEEKIMELIDECMASNYKGIIFNKLQPTKETTSQRIDRLIKQAEMEEENDKSRNN